MDSAATGKPALLGGPPSITIAEPDGWDRIGEEEVQLVADMVRRGEMSLAGHGIAKEIEQSFADYTGIRHAAEWDDGKVGSFGAASSLGFKLRPHAVAMALAKIQLVHLPRLLAKRRETVAKLDAARGGCYGNYWALLEKDTKDTRRATFL